MGRGKCEERGRIPGEIVKSTEVSNTVETS